MYVWLKSRCINIFARCPLVKFMQPQRVGNFAWLLVNDYMHLPLLFVPTPACVCVCSSDLHVPLCAWVICACVYLALDLCVFILACASANKSIVTPPKLRINSSKNDALKMCVTIIYTMVDLPSQKTNDCISVLSVIVILKQVDISSEILYMIFIVFHIRWGVQYFSCGSILIFLYGKKFEKNKSWQESFSLYLGVWRRTHQWTKFLSSMHNQIRCLWGLHWKAAAETQLMYS